MYKNHSQSHHSYRSRRKRHGSSLAVSEPLNHESNQPETPVVSSGVFATLIPALQKAVAKEGYTIPTQIQTQAIPYLLSGKDLLGCAQTGTGKTAAFALPLLQILSNRKKAHPEKNARLLVLTPTRELAAQIDGCFRAYGRFLSVSHTVIYGGVRQKNQVADLRRGVDIIVATPGRLLDLIRQKHIHLDKIEMFVLDEADRMLDMGFIPDVRRIVAMLPASRQTLFFSATMPPEVVSLANEMVKDPVHITIDSNQPTVELIEHKLLFVQMRQKPDLMVNLLSDPSMEKVLVFTRTKHGADKLARCLMNAHIETATIHGSKSQSARTKALNGFKKGTVRTLVATDIAARGIDVEGITHVLNYDLPSEPGTYVHRVGRTARAGASGIAISFCTAEDRYNLRDIERLIRKSIPVDSSHPYHSEPARVAAEMLKRPSRVRQSDLNPRTTRRIQASRIFGGSKHQKRNSKR